MIIDKLLKDSQTSRYRLSKESGVPQATISDLCSGKTSLEKCSAGTLYKIAKALHVTVDSILEADECERTQKNYRSSFETFKSNICHYVKDMGDMEFIIHVLETDQIRELYKKQWYLEALYLLGMLDYLSKENGLPVCTNYNDIRKQKLSQTVYPSSVLVQAAIMHNEDIKKEARKKAIPEFMQFNIVESEVRNLA